MHAPFHLNQSLVSFGMQSSYSAWQRAIRIAGRLGKLIAPFPEHACAQITARPRHRRKSVEPFIGTSGIDDRPRVETFLVLGNDGIERAAPTPAQDLYVFFRIGSCADRPHYFIEI